MDCRATQWLDQERSGISPVQHAGVEEGTGRVQACLSGAQSAQNRGDAGKLRVRLSGKRQSDTTSQLQITKATPTIYAPPRSASPQIAPVAALPKKIFKPVYRERQTPTVEIPSKKDTNE